MPGDEGSAETKTKSKEGARTGLFARIENRLSEPTNVHWHGLASPPGMDGHPSDVIAPGQSRAIAFPIVDRAGTYFADKSRGGREREAAQRCRRASASAR